MKRPGKPVRTTIVMGLAFGLLFVPVSTALNLLLPWHGAFRLTLWIFLAAYAGVLCRWAGASLAACGFPLAVLLASSFWLRSDNDFLCFLALILSWVRSGVCFRNPVWRALAAEVVVGLGGTALVVFFAPHSMVAWALGVWMFFLVQSLYFVLIGDLGDAEESEAPVDPFEKARRGAEEILSTGA
ncbi:MAG: hypothetical protein AB9873_10665 [Syntrophobacteraceae bacterium]